uniref:Uncharacterized protein n=1 Tax=Pithovirus LCPAC302 TaxID=2506593 RepID=A0A481Z8U6_9VIRU|nr:MAG: uncharacterized protein LCPAC302_01490 [Pithovirus LCPAC302]
MYINIMGISNIDGDDEIEGADPLLQFLIVLFIILLIVSVGTIGYRIFAELEWIDAFHNGAMVFTSTSLVVPVKTYIGKIFSSFYNLLSGIFVLIIIGVIVRRGLRGAGISTIPTTSNNNDDDDSKDYTNVFDIY